MLYTGDPLDVCPITFVPVGELERPVGFDSAHAFECEGIVEWLTRHKSTNPLTLTDYSGAPVAEILHPLIVNGRTSHVAHTRQILLMAEPAKVASRHAMCKLGSDAVLFFLGIFWKIYGGTSAPIASLDAVTIVLLLACILWHYPVCGRQMIYSYLMVSLCYTLVFITCWILWPPSARMIVHLWSTHLFSVKVAIDVMTEAFGANIQ
jgi:hypothetical protein